MNADECGAEGTPVLPPPVVEPPTPSPTASPADRQLADALQEAAEMTKRAHRAIERAKKLTGNPWIDTVTGSSR